jgi:hypothetical protein
MSLDMPAHAGLSVPEAAQPAAETEEDQNWLETIVLAAGTTFAVLFVSSLSVLMYLS